MLLRDIFHVPYTTECLTDQIKHGGVFLNSNKRKEEWSTNWKEITNCVHTILTHINSSPTM